MRKWDWDSIPDPLQRQIETAMLICFGIGFIAGFVGNLLAETLT
jgi:hypothetical protein